MPSSVVTIAASSGDGVGLGPCGAGLDRVGIDLET